VLQLRLRVIEAVRLHMLPKPVFKLKHAFPIFNTGLALHASFYQPLDGERLRNIGRSGAHCLIWHCKRNSAGGIAASVSCLNCVVLKRFLKPCGS
jgi:hypothetical protein